MTLTEMLEDKSKYPGSILHVDEAKEIFKEWLDEVRLGTLMDEPDIFKMMRHDLIIMVDEP